MMQESTCFPKTTHSTFTVTFTVYDVLNTNRYSQSYTNCILFQISLVYLFKLIFEVIVVYKTTNTLEEYKYYKISHLFKMSSPYHQISHPSTLLTHPSLSAALALQPEPKWFFSLAVMGFHCFVSAFTQYGRGHFFSGRVSVVVINSLYYYLSGKFFVTFNNW